eukprot:TRINITY_DN45134_c0_g1_i2.p1 TRINITY_DN45134_c0_g1~~TRINITY_DN45134_c0_g1_i2.p1  ORF type:complete len:121 (-),score=0.74 TRINITY_DN45134_c0_g1_i2:20-382(-)
MRSRALEVAATLRAAPQRHWLARRKLLSHALPTTTNRHTTTTPHTQLQRPCDLLRASAEATSERQSNCESLSSDILMKDAKPAYTRCDLSVAQSSMCPVEHELKHMFCPERSLYPLSGKR